jgi:hypothetical protein
LGLIEERSRGSLELAHIEIPTLELLRRRESLILDTPGNDVEGRA